ncbi:hypothetical protein NBRC3255_0125 [Gluconobacter thailandicus NBRC 3255]|nr:hypothetical protein NBRC3255_0125 [Gluconobacter thailandicus NBRC 3255]
MPQRPEGRSTASLILLIFQSSVFYGNAPASRRGVLRSSQCFSSALCRKLKDS